VSFGEPPAFLAESAQRLEAIRGVRDARLNLVCCDNGQLIVYVGVEERRTTPAGFHAAPVGDARLSPDLVAAGKEFEAALMTAVRSGQMSEDRTQGHSLTSDPGLRAIQERFIAFAHAEETKLLQVLRESADPRHRALAAQVLAYVDDKQAIVPDLVFAMGDPAEGVRNDAMRTLLVFTQMQPSASRVRPDVPYEPFIALLHSPIWSDLNKASGALDGLTASRNPKLLAQLKREALEPLVEMARWKSEGHAFAACMILGRIGGLSEDAILQAIKSGNRESIILAATR
jgi:hypothetical protein